MTHRFEANHAGAMSSPAATGVLAAFSWVATLGTILAAGAVAFLAGSAPAERDMGWDGLPLAIGAVVGLYVMAGTSVIGLLLAGIGLGMAQTTAYRRALQVALAINVTALMAFLLLYLLAEASRR